MPRAKRICLPNLTYHVYSRCINQDMLLARDEQKDMFLEVIALAQQRMDFELVSYVIMSNHFHLIVKTVEGGATIAEIMQYIKSLYARRFNRKAGRIGPFWNERYRDVIIDFAENPVCYLLWLIWYLAFNPVRAGLSVDPRKYQYSSIQAYLSERVCSAGVGNYT
jgi:putative transposase